VEGLNAAAEKMFFAQLPRYTHAPTLANRRPADVDAPALRYEAFIAELLRWVAWWNTDHPMEVLDGRTPLQAWLDDPTPLITVPAADLRLFTLEDDGKPRKITTKGVSWRHRWYVGAWMTGQVGRSVRLRYMPHHEHDVEVFDAGTGVHLGPAVLSDQADPELIAAVRRTRRTKAARLAADLRAVERTRRERYAASTTPEPARPLRALTRAEAETELAAGDEDSGAVARPLLRPLGRPRRAGSCPAPCWPCEADRPR
jgi:putative transposase